MNRTVRTVKTGTYRFVDRVDAPDDATVVFHLKEPWASLLWNVANGAIGIVPYGSGADFYRNPIGSGPFRLISNQQDREVVLERNDQYWRERPRIPRVRMTVVPDTTTRALELRKGSADAAINALSLAPGGGEAQVIGEVREQPAGTVLVTTRYGGSRIVDMLVGDPLPRIC